MYLSSVRKISNCIKKAINFVLLHVFIYGITLKFANFQNQFAHDYNFLNHIRSDYHLIFFTKSPNRVPVWCLSSKWTRKPSFCPNVTKQVWIFFFISIPLLLLKFPCSKNGRSTHTLIDLSKDLICLD